MLLTYSNIEHLGGGGQRQASHGVFGIGRFFARPGPIKKLHESIRMCSVNFMKTPKNRAAHPRPHKRLRHVLVELVEFL